MREFNGHGLHNSHDERWLSMRRHLATGFLTNRLKKMMPIQREVLDEAMEGFAQRAGEGPVDIYQEMVKVSLALIGKSLFGRRISDEELQVIADAISDIQGFILRQIVQPYLIPWFRLSGKTAYYQKIRSVGESLIEEHIDIRRRDGGGGSDMLGHMLETPYEDTGRPMEDSQLLIETLQLLIAGNESSSIALAWTFYLLARHPECIARIRAEIESVVGEGPLDFAALRRLEYTTQVLNEALRLYPPFWMIDRIAQEEDEAAGIHIPAGIMVIPYIYGTHRNPDFWPDAEIFDPDRFESASAKKRHPYAHIPFGGGPRICIGADMAMLQSAMVLVSYIRDFDFELASERPSNICPMMLLRPDGPIPLRFRKVAKVL
jgi:cytochrome P450